MAASKLSVLQLRSAFLRTIKEWSVKPVHSQKELTSVLNLHLFNRWMEENRQLEDIKKEVDALANLTGNKSMTKYKRQWNSTFIDDPEFELWQLSSEVEEYSSLWKVRQWISVKPVNPLESDPDRRMLVNKRTEDHFTKMHSVPVPSIKQAENPTG